jgi:dTDP-4-dehydrorhamnose 3,5-epimerase
VLSHSAEILYKCDAGYHPEDEHGIAYNDPGLAIDWGVHHALLSRRDQSHPTLASVPAQLLPLYIPPPPTTTP